MQTKKKTILVVEDDPHIGELIVFLLTEDGYQTRYAPNGLAALEQLADCTVDLVLTDLMMPSMDGFGLLRKLQATEQLASIPVLMITAVPEEVVRQEYLRPTRLIGKPFTSRVLLESVRDILDRYPGKTSLDIPARKG